MHSPAKVEEGRRRPAPTPSRQRPSVQTLLAGLEREQLQALLLHLIERQSELADVVEAQVHRVRIEPAGDASAPQERRTPVDPNVFRRQVRTILRSLDRMRSSEAYWHVGAVVNEVRQVLEQAQGFVAAGDGHNTLLSWRPSLRPMSPTGWNLTTPMGRPAPSSKIWGRYGPRPC